MRQLSAGDGTQRGAVSRLRELLPGTRVVRDAGPGAIGLLERAGAGPGQRGSKRGRAEAPAGSHRAAEFEARIRGGIREAAGRKWFWERNWRAVPDVPGGGGKRRPDGWRRREPGIGLAPQRAGAEHQPDDGIGNGEQPSDTRYGAIARCVAEGRSAAWERADCRHHKLHEYEQSFGDVGGGVVGQEGGGAGSAGEPAGEGVAGAGIASGQRLLEQDRVATVPRSVGFQPGGLWLHDLHWEFRAAAGAGR